MALYCVDLDSTITAAPDVLRPILRGLKAANQQVHVLSGDHGPVTAEVIRTKKRILTRLGFDGCYDHLNVVAGPEKRVASEKVAYMRAHNAKTLIDNSKRNVKAAHRAGFVAFRLTHPKDK
jgi:hypothetical protein